MHIFSHAKVVIEKGHQRELLCVAWILQPTYYFYHCVERLAIQRYSECRQRHSRISQVATDGIKTVAERFLRKSPVMRFSNIDNRGRPFDREPGEGNK